MTIQVIERKDVSEEDYANLAAALRFAQDSRDLSTQNGACLVNEEGDMTFGSNDLAYPLKETDERLERPLKHAWTEHAERSAIYRAARSGTFTDYSTLYCPWYACADCARAIVYSGITRVVGLKAMFDGTPKSWKESVALGFEILEEARVKTVLLDVYYGPEVVPKLRFNGKAVQF